MNGAQIRKITAERLTYLDENGTEASIDFSICYQNYLTRLLEPGNLERIKKLNQLNDKGLKKTVKRLTEWREIARRNIIGDSWGTSPPYIEFYTDPDIRFEFSTKEEFWQVRSEIEQFGWKTFDLS